MQIKTIQPIQTFCFETKTSLQEISGYVRSVAKQLYKDAIKNNLEITGPVYWVYDGADGQPDTVFNLTIALPVSQNDQQIVVSEFKLKKLNAFRCISQTHNGAWDKLGETYNHLLFEIQVKDPALSGQNREIYINMDFETPENNITEVQIGLI